MIRNLQLRNMKRETPLDGILWILWKHARRCFQLKMVAAEYLLSGAVPMAMIRRRCSGPSVMVLKFLHRYFLTFQNGIFLRRLKIRQEHHRCTVTNTQATIIHVKSGSTFLKWIFLLFLLHTSPFWKNGNFLIGYRQRIGAKENSEDPIGCFFLSLMFYFRLRQNSRTSS